MYVNCAQCSCYALVGFGLKQKSGHSASPPPKQNDKILFSQAMLQLESRTQCVHHAEHAPCEHVECRLHGW